MKQLPIGIPIIASLAAFILLLLALLAGSRPGFMEDYDLVAFNTSGLGKNLIDFDGDEKPTPTSSSGSGLCDGLGGILGKACTSATAVVDSVKDDVEETLNDIGNRVADRLADRLGISEFYSLHALTICEGDFKPNATANGADRNVTECHQGFTEGYNISSLLDHSLRVGPFKVSLLDLGFTSDIQNAIDTLNTVLKAFTALLIIGLGFTGLSLIASVLALFLIPRREGPVLSANTILAGLALGFLVLSGLLGTIGASIAEDKVNELGDDIGLAAKMGSGYVTLTWVGVGLMLVAFGYWLWQHLRFKNGRRMAVHSRKHPRDSEESGAMGEKPASRVDFLRGRR
ncbi:actin cortical patch SUR7/pH-response regulator pali [Podospora conica]|nr:actin cortical patch SUR7/pH-response regulator pali [Schizothecium conicum]